MAEGAFSQASPSVVSPPKQVQTTLLLFHPRRPQSPPANRHTNPLPSGKLLRSDSVCGGDGGL